MGDDLEARLKSHARAFEGLMSLIPAKEYYGKDESITSTQWLKKKKQSREERQAAKRAKLDPASHKTAKDIMDENARKRKRELEGEAESSDPDMDIEKEKPMEGLKTAAAKTKKQKTKETNAQLDADQKANTNGDNDAHEARAKARAEKKQQKLEKKKEKQAQKKQNQATKKAQQTEFSKTLVDTKEANKDEEEEEEANKEWLSDEEQEYPDERIQALDVSGLIEEGQSTATPSAANSNSSTASIASAASSSSSVMPPSGEQLPKKEKKAFNIDPKSHDAFRARLNAKLEAMRAARKADGPDGRPARNRAELIEARRKKEAERKAARKESRQLAKEDEERLKAEEQLARIRGGSGSPSLFAPLSSPDSERNFNFGKVAWQDGQQLEGNLSGFLDSRKKKGKSDVKTALEAAQKKKARINGLDDAKRKDIQEKDLWLAAKKRAQGEKVLDDPNLLKKSLKRQLKAKEKSKQEWKDRITNVQKGKENKQKKREENLKKRREEKGNKGNKKKPAKPGKKVKRPGFEGTFKAR